jgi:hypothetical protein
MLRLAHILLLASIARAQAPQSALQLSPPAAYDLAITPVAITHQPGLLRSGKLQPNTRTSLKPAKDLI